MPLDASSTRDKLIDEAARAFAAARCVRRIADRHHPPGRPAQPGRVALPLRLASGVLCAVLERHVEFLARREGELLEVALAAPDDDVRSVVEAIVRPGDRAGGERLARTLLPRDPRRARRGGSRGPRSRSGRRRSRAPAVTRCTTCSPRGWPTSATRSEPNGSRWRPAFILRAVADRARVLGRRGRRGRPQLEHEAFVENLVAMVAAGMSAPLSDR